MKNNLLLTLSFSTTLIIVCGRSLPAQPADETTVQMQNQPTVSNLGIESEDMAMDYSDAELVNDPVQGTYLLSKSRSKNWVARAAYIFLANLGLIALIFSLPKNEEINFIVCYALSGTSLVLGLWVTLCALLLYKLGNLFWLATLPVGLIMTAATYLLLMKIKKDDAALLDLKKSFLKMADSTTEDTRLHSVNGEASDWPDLDFIR